MLTQGRVLTVVFHAFIKDYIGISCLRTCFTSSPFQSSSLSSERSGEQSETRSEEAGNKSSV